ncbi:MAG: hypothetical protein GQ565_12480 [Candidatus Aegiribacteria sp.]|nr:hypothetical protein [Candidatus Aegiribacteria sp.]
MKRLIIICILTASHVTSAPSTVSFYSVSISLHQDTLHRTIEIRGIQGSDRLLSRITRGFNPETQSISLERALFGFPEGDSGPIPGWAVDTLTGNAGWQLSLVTAFPALRAGMTIDYRIVISDWSGNWERGVWTVLSPSVKGIRPDTSRFTVSGDMLMYLSWHGTGYDIKESDERLEFTATDSSSVLVISPFRTFREMEEFIMQETAVILDSPYPLDLREAALQATSAGAYQYAQAERARSLLCNSINPSSIVRGGNVCSVHSLQEILDLRRGTPLEIALVFAAMCRELGMEADIIPAGSIDYAIPVPEGWNRFLVRLTSEDGDSWFMEPSAYLTSASYIYRPDTLYVIENGNIKAIPPNTPEENRVLEDWRVNPYEGTFNLELECSGWYDMMLRRRFAGLSREEMILSLSEWSWLSGRTVISDSLTLSDPFDLGTDMKLTVHGKLWMPVEISSFAEYLPHFDWMKPECIPAYVTRIWKLSGIDSVYSPAYPFMEILEDTVILTDTSEINSSLPVVFELLE